MSELQPGYSTKEAINFLISRIAEQAQNDSVPLSREELNQLSFSEETASDGDIAAATEFDKRNDQTLLERKVTKLLRHAFKEDVKNGKSALWKTHLSALSDKDVYVLVMVDQAQIPRPKPNLIRSFVPKSGQEFTALIRLLVAWSVPLAGALYFFILPMRWGRRADDPYIFGSLVHRLELSDVWSGILFAIWVISCILVMLYHPKPKT